MRTILGLGHDALAFNGHQQVSDGAVKMRYREEVMRCSVAHLLVSVKGECVMPES